MENPLPAALQENESSLLSCMAYSYQACMTFHCSVCLFYTTQVVGQ